MNRITTLLLFSIATVSIASCKKNDNNPDKGKALVLTAAEKQKVAADNAFTLKFVKQLNSGDTGNENLFMSPLSVSFAIGMSSNGAKGETLQGIDNAMEFTGFTHADINSYYNKLINELPGLEPNTRLNIANSIWYKQGFAIVPDFLNVNTSAYKAKVQAADFSASATKNEMNKWVSDQTNGKIPALISDIQPDARLYLLNAIYFKSIWKNKFKAADTKKLEFKTAAGNTVQADFMTGNIDINRYYEENNGKYTQIAELPYANDRFSFVVVLPDESTTIKQLITSLDTAKWNNWMRRLGEGKSAVYMPKLKFSYDIDLKNPLTALGMGQAFSNTADFSGISTSENLQITKALHKAYIEVDEQGTEAAAATSVEHGVTAALPSDLKLNRPYMFVIRERSSGLILFAGIVNNPLLTGN